MEPAGAGHQRGQLHPQHRRHTTLSRHRPQGHRRPRRLPLAFEEPNDCEEAILTFLKLPDTLDNAESLSAGDIMRELSFRGFRGREYNAISIGRCMKRLGFETKKIRGVIKYLVTKVDPDLHNRENKEDSKLFVPEIF